VTSDSVALDGRALGRRGLQTRRRLLDATAQLLETAGIRDLRVVDIARAVGTSPATFYQYFPDIQTAVVELANEVLKEAGALKDLASEPSWSGRSGTVAAAALVDGFLGFWREHDAILRVVDTAAAEGDRRFSRIRMKLLNSVVSALSEAISELQRGGKVDADVHPAATAGALVTMLAASAAHTKAFDSWSVKDGELRAGLTRLVAWGVTGRKPA
jgi:AcrR family transcriptional regulator